MSRRNIDQIQRERILAEKIQVYDEAYKLGYELGYQSGREHNEHKIDDAYDLMAQALETLKELTEESADDYIDAIVPCRECKHHRIVSDDLGDYPKCELHNGIWWLGDFCSKGEREESEEK